MHRFVMAAVLVAATGLALAQPAGKIRVCRHPGITELGDRMKVAIQAPVFFKLPGDSYDGSTDTWIEVSKDFTIGAKPACVTLDGVVTRNVKNAPSPKAGTTWTADATAVPGQYFGKRPVEREIVVNGIRGTVVEGSNNEIQGVSLQARPVSDFK